MQGAHAIKPKVQIGYPKTFDAIDEAIENLFGYDWILFRNVLAIEYFLKRLSENGHEISEMDSLRVCAIGAAAAEKLTASQVHADVVVSGHHTGDAVTDLASYVGGREPLAGINFLNPRAHNSVESLSDELRRLGARVDAVSAYRTLPANVGAQLNTLLSGGGVDCVIFHDQEGLEQFAELVDTNDLQPILNSSVIACPEPEVASAAASFGLKPQIVANGDIHSLMNSIIEFFSSPTTNL
jgi:uroporphyrinogen-III synthase